MLNSVHARVAEWIGFAEHFGCLGPLSLSNETLGSEVAANNAHIYEARHSLLLFCRDVDHGSRTDGKPRRKGRLAGLAFRVERDSGGLCGERAGEKALCARVAMRHEVCLGKPKRIIRLICGWVSGRRRRRREERTH